MREELSLLFAEEIKNLDDKYRSEKLVLEDNLQKLIQTLQVRTKEVELLKTAVLSERDCYRKSLEEKEKIINDKSREIDVGVVQKYEAKIEMCEERVSNINFILCNSLFMHLLLFIDTNSYDNIR